MTNEKKGRDDKQLEANKVWVSMWMAASKDRQCAEAQSKITKRQQKWERKEKWWVTKKEGKTHGRRKLVCYYYKKKKTLNQIF